MIAYRHAQGGGVGDKEEERGETLWETWGKNK